MSGRAAIAGCGIAVPDQRLTNAYLAALVDTSAAWIVERTGIRARRIAGPGETTASLATGAGAMAVKQAGLTPDDIDLLVVATATPVISNGDARPYDDGDGWRTRLADHLVEPVRWRQSIGTMVDMGVTEFVELGPGEALTGMVKRTLAVAST